LAIVLLAGCSPAEPASSSDSMANVKQKNQLQNQLLMNRLQVAYKFIEIFLKKCLHNRG